MILLTEKDADFINAVIRREIVRNHKSMENMLQQLESEYKAAKAKKIQLAPEGEKEIRGAIEDVSYEFIKEIALNTLKGQEKDLVRIIELMTTGSTPECKEEEHDN